MKYLLLFLVGLIMSACSASDAPTVTVRIAVPEESVSDVMHHLENLDPRTLITFKYTPFDVRLDSHPNIAGFVEITGPAKVNGVGYEKETLVGFINGLKSKNALPVDNRYWNRNGNEFRMLEDQVRSNEARGIKQQYIILTNDELRLVYNRRNAAPDSVDRFIEKSRRESSTKE